MPEDAPGNPGAVRLGEQPARQVAAYHKVREMQAKLHRWAGEGRSRRFGDLFNLVDDLDFLAEGWLRVKANAGSRTPGIDKATVADIGKRIGAGASTPMVNGSQATATSQSGSECPDGAGWDRTVSPTLVSSAAMITPAARWTSVTAALARRRPRFSNPTCARAGTGSMANGSCRDSG